MNRRDFVRNFTSSLATTAVLSVSGRSAFGGMFPGQNENEISNSSSMFPSGELEIPPEPSVPESVHDDVNLWYKLSVQFQSCDFVRKYPNWWITCVSSKWLERSVWSSIDAGLLIT